jgi:Xaa-Pro aminopeptidase
MAPFDAEKLWRLMDKAGVDLVLANTRPNILYLTGGYYFHFHQHLPRIGPTAYLPLLGLPRGRIDDAFFVGVPQERGQMDVERLWIDKRIDAPRGTLPAARAAAARIKELGLDRATIGVELPFLPADAAFLLQKELPQATLVDATDLLDALRAHKTPRELELLRSVHDRVAQAIQAGFAIGRPGITTAEVAEHVRREMTLRGLTFLYVFTCAGPSVLRAPSQMPWERGRLLHIDAGGEEKGYMADICHMGVLGEPTPLGRALYDACIAVQDRVRAVARPGVPCNELIRVGQEAIAASPFPQHGRIIIHGMGVVSHEYPHVNAENRSPLEPGHVLSIETEFIHPDEGFVKIEDSVAITATGNESLGDRGRELHVIPV